MRLRASTACMVALLAVLLAPHVHAQNIDWDILWENDQPSNPNSTVHYVWMYGSTQYTGIAYDRVRDLLYVVNPAKVTVGNTTTYVPRIWIWDPASGNLARTQGRAAVTGIGGQLPVPADTIFGYPNSGWPYAGQSYAGINQGRQPIYKIAVDDEGRIFACNLVSPVWGICYPGPAPNCDSNLLAQGPFRIFRWDTPKSTPKRVYATLNAASTAIGGADKLNSEMPWFRWGDVLDVRGKRTYALVNGVQTLVDSARIFVGGGGFAGEEQYFPDSKHNEIDVFVADTRTPGVSDGLGGRLEYRLGTRLIDRSGLSSLYWRGAQGIAAEGSSPTDMIWHDSNGRLAQVTRNNQGIPNNDPTTPMPWIVPMTHQVRISSDTVAGTGYSGPMAWFTWPGTQWKYLIVADGQSSTGILNRHNRARMINVTNELGAYKSFSDTPDWGSGRPFETMVGRGYSYDGPASTLDTLGPANAIVDVDYKIDTDSLGNPMRVLIFVLMSNNGIVCFGNHPIPVSLESFTADIVDDQVSLVWQVASETNNHGWTVQRSFDGGNRWDDIAFVSGAGTSTAHRTYTHDDPITETHRAVGRAQYRLMQSDLDGTTTPSHVAEVVLRADDEGLHTLYQNHPNPCNPTTTISYRLGAPAFVTLTVSNQLGEQVAVLAAGYQSAGMHAEVLDASHLASGVYIVHLNANGTMLQRRMIVTK